MLAIALGHVGSVASIASFGHLLFQDQISDALNIGFLRTETISFSQHCDGASGNCGKDFIARFSPSKKIKVDLTRPERVEEPTGDGHCTADTVIVHVDLQPSVIVNLGPYDPEVRTHTLVNSRRKIDVLRLEAVARDCEAGGMLPYWSGDLSITEWL
ncbi:MAG: hypothetical protein AAF481_10235 [Acidobacteriota bacterium]